MCFDRRKQQSAVVPAVKPSTTYFAYCISTSHSTGRNDVLFALLSLNPTHTLNRRPLPPALPERVPGAGGDVASDAQARSDEW